MMIKRVLKNWGEVQEGIVSDITEKCGEYKGMRNVDLLEFIADRVYNHGIEGGERIKEIRSVREDNYKVFLFIPESGEYKDIVLGVIDNPELIVEFSLVSDEEYKVLLPLYIERILKGLRYPFREEDGIEVYG